MAEHRSDKSRYLSRYAVNTWVAPAQYIAELVCEKAAKKNNEVLPLQFWQAQPWKNTFVRQAALAAKLLQTFHVTDIINSIEECKGLTSLASPFLKSILKKKYEVRQRELAKVVETVPTQTTTVIKTRPAFKTRRDIREGLE